jgi:SAM-dependent methyltransferase
MDQDPGRAVSALPPAAEILREQLSDVPAFRALLRAVEAALVAASGPRPEPVLDLGCGDGHFAGRVLSSQHLLGVDLELAGLVEASHRRAFRALVAASATALPFAGGSLGSVVANSVLEHVPDLSGALAEASRVLRPGGRLVITAPGHRFSSTLLGHRFLSALGLGRAAEAYARWLTRRAPHHHLLAAGEWERRLQRRGFRVERSLSYFSPAALRAFELLHYLGIPTLVCRRLTGRWVPWRNPLTRAAAVRWLGPLATTRPAADGTCVLLEAVRLAAAPQDAA